ncbi:YafY family protein [Nesterenkonia sp. HG001]|uniref:helix-turn-helix transcriptional regulator n=1 Tax=Nesterenkonia sp. HG001 TaxID=2983207 RepID=UPI002AC74EC2|nr:YafY family protein [Nesterenkonia sp. HG001]MDZ5078804.1 YafY family transcriptional regulator [Nesterenkonia sp. HG001]
MASDTTDPTRRALQILGFMQARSSASAEEIAKRLGVTTRTVRRDVQRLRDLGYGIESTAGQGGGYRLVAGSNRPVLVLEPEEASAVVLGLAHLTDLGLSGLEDAALSALAKVSRTMPPQVSAAAEKVRRGTAVVGARDAQTPVEHVALLAEAAAERRTVTFSHRREGSPRDRRADPYRVVSFAGRWYLFAWCHLRQDWRTFRVDRIGDVHVTTLHYTVAPSPDPVATVKDAVLRSPYPLVARVIVEAPADQVRPRLSPHAADVEPAGPHHALVTIGAQEADWVAVHLAGLRLPLQVIEPPELVEELRLLGRDLTAVTLVADPGVARAID